MKLSASMRLAWFWRCSRRNFGVALFYIYIQLTRADCHIEFPKDFSRLSTHLLEFFIHNSFSMAQLAFIITGKQHLLTFRMFRVEFLCRAHNVGPLPFSLSVPRTFVIYDLQYNMALHSYFNKPFFVYFCLFHSHVSSLFFSFFPFFFVSWKQRCNLLRWARDWARSGKLPDKRIQCKCNC